MKITTREYVVNFDGSIVVPIKFNWFGFLTVGFAVLWYRQWTQAIHVFVILITAGIMSTTVIDTCIGGFGVMFIIILITLILAIWVGRNLNEWRYEHWHTKPIQAKTPTQAAYIAGQMKIKNRPNEPILSV